MLNYGFAKEISASFEETLDKVSNELKKEGFGILTQIDVMDSQLHSLKSSYSATVCRITVIL
jgi:uncharacterized protein (DUF302 family)